MGPTGKNFALKMLNLLANNKKINVINDQIGSPTTTSTLAKACWETISLNLKGNSTPSILHFANEGEASWFEIAVEIEKITKDLGLINKKILINPISSSEYKLSQRGSIFSLRFTKIFESISFKKQHWKKAIQYLFKEYKKNSINLNLFYFCI